MFHSLSAASAFLFSASTLLISVNADILPFNNSLEYMNGSYGAYPRQRYLSNSGIVGPVANVITSADRGQSPSKYVMWSAEGSFGDVNPMMLEANTGAVVYSAPAYQSHAMGPTVQQCNATNYISWWSGVGQIDSRSAGRYYIYNTDYELVYNISTKGYLRYADCHEFLLTPQCTAIITAYETRPYDLSHYNITDGYLMDSYFQEIDLATDEVIFQWQASAHVNVTDAIWQPEAMDQGKSIHRGYDFFHLNSVQKDHLGNYLLSSRHTNSVYYISGINGNVIWTLGGKGNDFVDLSGGNATNTRWQHHARWVDANLTKLSIFDNRNTRLYNINEHNLTRGIIVDIDTVARTAKLDKAYLATKDAHVVREGSFQVLTDSPESGNVMMGLGSEPTYTEYSANGTVLLDIAFGPMGRDRATADNYRALKVNWTGAPSWSPRIASGPAPNYDFNLTRQMFEVLRQDPNGSYLKNTTAYFSWNGATEMSYWILLASNESTTLSVSSNYFAKVSKIGFETSFEIGNAAKYVQALAVDVDDTVTGASAVVEMQSGALLAQDVRHVVFDLQSSTKQLKAMLAKSHNVVSTIKETWVQVEGKMKQVKNDPTGKAPVIAGIIGGLCTAALLAVCIVPLILRCRRRRGYTSFNGQDYTDGELNDMEKSRPSVTVSHADNDDEFEQARGYFDEFNDDADYSERETSVSSSADSTLCGSQQSKEEADKA